MEGDALAVAAAIVLAAAIVWLALEIRAMHDDLQPLIDSPIVTALAAAGR